MSLVIGRLRFLNLNFALSMATMLNHMTSMSLRYGINRRRHATRMNEAGKQTKAESNTNLSHTLILCLFNEFVVLNDITSTHSR